MKFPVLTQPIEGIERKLPLPEEFEAQISGFVSSLTRGESIAGITGRTMRWLSSMPSLARIWSISLWNHAAG